MSTPSTADVDQVLTLGELHIVGRMVDASNTTLKCVAELNGTAFDCIYKPREGERPLWDFATGTLGRREVATYLISEWLGWDLVPVTVWRDDGPLGPGMCQLWFDADDHVSMVDVVPLDRVVSGWHTIIEAGDGYGGRVRLVHADDPVLRRLAAFDVVVNNADRKGGHILAGTTLEGHRVVGIDHGVCLHDEDKLRTVLWGWAGERLDDEIRAALEVADIDAVVSALAPHLSRRELRSLHARTQALLAAGTFPLPVGDWPPLPWPVI